MQLIYQEKNASKKKQVKIPVKDTILETEKKKLVCSFSTLGLFRRVIRYFLEITLVSRGSMSRSEVMQVQHLNQIKIRKPNLTICQ